MARHAPELACPRCGYDVSGVVPTWKETCPLEGTCSECGLVSLWVDVFRPDRIVPAWSFEHARVRLGRKWLATLGRSLLPHKFWSEMRLAARLNLGRLGILALSCLAIGWLGVMACGGLFCHQVMLAFGAATTGLPGWFPSLGNPWNKVLTFAAWPGHRIGWIGSLLDGLPTFAFLWALLAPVPFVVLAQTLSRAKCRHVHLLRGWGYQWPVLIVLVLVPLALRAWSPTTSWGWPRRASSEAVPTLLVAAWMGWYWCSFTRLYLRLPRAVVVGNVMLVVSALLALVSDMAIAPRGESIIERMGWFMV